MERTGMTAETPGQDPVGEDPRIASLEARIAQAEHAERVRQGARVQNADDGSRLGNRVLAELIGGLVGGALIGWTLDQLFGTRWLLLVFLGLGTAAAFRNIIRISTKPPGK
jgi:ATP synthase protein I